VEHFISEKGKSLLPIIGMMKEWGMENIISKQTVGQEIV
jgi:DNA-binding HxlR family transcriptional regulator